MITQKKNKNTVHIFPNLTLIKYIYFKTTYRGRSESQDQRLCRTDIHRWMIQGYWYRFQSDMGNFHIHSYPHTYWMLGWKYILLDSYIRMFPLCWRISHLGRCYHLRIRQRLYEEKRGNKFEIISDEKNLLFTI